MPESHPEPKSRKRRAHCKSRNGCKACKSRRTKCDERGPPCVNCVIRKTECVYPDSSKIIPQVACTPSSTTGNSPSTLGVSSDHVGRNVLELKLLFQWATHTAETLESGGNEFHGWRLRVTAEAFGFDPLLDAIMAISAAHVADGMTISQENRAIFVNASLDYYSRCCKKFKDQVMNMTKENGRAFFSCSVVLLILRMHIQEYGHQVESSVERVLAAFELLQGTWSIAHIAHDLEDGALDKHLLLRTHKTEDLDDNTDTALKNLMALNKTFVQYSRFVDAENRVVCEEAIELLRQWWMRVNDGRYRTPLIWLLFVSRGYILLVRQKHPMAQLVLLHWSVLFEQVNDSEKWFSRSISRRLVQELTASLSDEQYLDERWKASISWTERMVFQIERSSTHIVPSYNKDGVLCN